MPKITKRRKKSRRANKKKGGADEVVVAKDIIINPHQIEAVYKVLTSNIKGILLWHMMGTGKTISGLTFILNHPDKDIIILCPQELTFFWKTEVKRIPEINNNIIYYSYEKISELFSAQSLVGKILVIDEIHNLTVLLRKSSRIHQKMELLKTATGIMALTGTPIYSDLSDLSYIINICAGKQIMPYNDVEFRKIFYKTNVVKSAGLSYAKNLGLAVSATATAAVAVKLAIGYKKTYNAYSDITGNWFYHTAESEKSLSHAWNVQHNQLATHPDPDSDLHKTAQTWMDEYHKYFRDNSTSLFSPTSDPADPALTDIAIVAGVALSIFAITKAMGMMMNVKAEDYQSLNAKRIVDVIIPYVSYYKNDPSENDYFPEVLREVKNIPYNIYQMKRWIELTQDCLNVKNVADLSITSEEDAKYFVGKIDVDTYLSRGLSIGNFSDKTKGEHAPKFHAILKMAKGKRAVFYSNFTKNGIESLKDFFDAVGENYEYLDAGIPNFRKTHILQNFYEASTNNSQAFLLLHPSYSEGISVFGAEQMHILEPIISLAKKEQVVARVVRYLSHAHLPKERQKVRVIQWVCENTTAISNLKKMAVSIYKWFRLKSQVDYNDSGTVIGQDSTPDSIAMKTERISIENEQNIIKLLKEVKKKDLDCCIAYPSKDQEESCMRKTKRQCVIAM